MKSNLYIFNCDRGLLIENFMVAKLQRSLVHIKSFYITVYLVCTQGGLSIGLINAILYSLIRYFCLSKTF